MHGYIIFLIFDLKHRLWLPGRTALERQFSFPMKFSFLLFHFILHGRFS